MVTEHWRKRRVWIFPYIKDWTKDVKEYHPKCSIKEMNYNQWFWFDSSAFKLIHFGFPTIGFKIFGLCATLSYIYFSQFLALIMGIIALGFGYNLIMKIKKRKVIEGMTFYDQFMKEEF